MKRLLLAAAFCAAATPALALFDQQAPGMVQIVDPAAPAAALGTVSHPLNTTGTFTGTIGGFPGGTGGVIGTPVTAVTTVTVGSTQSLPAGISVVATNTGSNMAFCQLGATANVNSQPISPSGGWFDFTVGSATQITCVTAASTTTINTYGGAGIATGTGGAGGGGGGGNVTVVGPVGTQASAASVAVTPATSSVWAGPLGVQAISGSQSVNPATSSVWGGPLGTQAISGSQAVNPATASVWPSTLGPDLAPITGAITANDTGSTSCVATAASQTICTGTPTPASVVSGAIGPAACLSVSSFVTSGTPVATLSTEFSPDNVNWLPRGLFLDGKAAPIWINNATGGVFSGQTPAAGMKYYRVRATSFSSSGTFTVTINQSQAGCVQYSGNLPTSANGSGATASVNTQFGGPSATPFDTNAKQQAGTTLGGPTVWGTAPTGEQVPGANVNCITGCSASTIAPFTPTGNTLATPLTPTTSSVSSIVAPTGGTSELITNNGTAVGYIRLTVGTGTATANDIPIQPGAGCVLTLGSNTWINAFNVAAGSSFNASAGNGLGNCPTGGGGGSAGSSGNVFQANAFANGSTSTATTNQPTQFAASGSTVFYLVNYAVQTDAAAGAAGTFQIVSGTGTNCVTSQIALTPVWNFPAGQGIQEGSLGVLGVSAAGGELCVKTTTSNQVNWRIGAVQQ